MWCEKLKLVAGAELHVARQGTGGAGVDDAEGGVANAGVRKAESVGAVEAVGVDFKMAVLFADLVDLF